MLRLVIATVAACATLGQGAALAQDRTTGDAAAAPAAREVAVKRSPAPAVPLGNMAEWVTFEDYPPRAARDELTGMTRVRLELNAQGLPTRCSITAMSGSETLDSTTCARLMERARFHPALNNAGKAVPAVIETGVVWSMRNTGPLSASVALPDLRAPAPKPIDMRSWFNILDLQFDSAVPGDRSVTYVLEVNGAGRATGCAFARGSGDERFDKSFCHLLERNAKFDVSSSGAGRFLAGFSIPEEGALALAAMKPAGSASRNYAINAFVEEDGRVSACKWVGPDAPALDPWRICNRSSWVDRRDVQGALVRGEVELAVSQREVDEFTRR